MKNYPILSTTFIRNIPHTFSHIQNTTKIDPILLQCIIFSIHPHPPPLTNHAIPEQTPRRLTADCKNVGRRSMYVLLIESSPYDELR